jgi:hypothetical protein
LPDSLGPGAELAVQRRPGDRRKPVQRMARTKRADLTGADSGR